MKKIILTLGSIGLVAMPITTLVSCGDSKKSTNNTTDNTTPTINIDDKISNLIKKLPDNVVSTKLDATLSTDVNSLDVDAIVEPTLVGLPIDFLTLEDGMSVSYTVNTAYDATTHTIKLNLKIFATSDNNISSTKVITIKGKYDFSAEKAKFTDKTSSKTATTLTHDASALNNLTPSILGITNPTNLIDGLTVTYSIDEETFTNGSTKTVTVHLTYNGQTDITTFKLTPTFDFISVKASFNNSIDSTKTANDLTNDASGLTNLTPTILGFTPPALPNGVSATYSIDDANFTSTTAKTVTVHLTYGDQTDTTTFKLTPHILTISDKISNLINKLPDNVVSTKFDATLSTDVVGLAVDAIVEPTLVGLPTNFLTLEDDMSASYTVNTAYDVTTHTIKLNLKVFATSDNNISSTKVITIKGKYDFSIEKAKFIDKTSTKLASTLIADISAINNIPDQELGITTPTLANGVTVSYSIANKTFTKGNPKTVTVDLSYDGQTDTTTFNLTPNTFEIVHNVTLTINGIHAMISDGQGGFFVGGNNGKFDHIDASGNKPDGWSTKTLLGGSTIYSMVSDGNDGFWVGGYVGKLDHIDGSGNLVAGWRTKTLLRGDWIYSIVSDGHDGFLVGGTQGKLDHIDAHGDLVHDWSTKTLLGGVSIESIISDGNGGFFIGGKNGKLDHIDVSGNLVDGWSTKTLLGGGDNHIYSIISDGHDGFWVGGIGGKLDHIDANGNLVHGWSTKTLLGGVSIESMVSDGHGGFFVGGTLGRIDHIDASGNLVDGWTTKTLLNGAFIESIISDGHGGFWVAGDSGQLVRFIYET